MKSEDDLQNFRVNNEAPSFTNPMRILRSNSRFEHPQNFSLIKRVSQVDEEPAQPLPPQLRLMSSTEFPQLSQMMSYYIPTNISRQNSINDPLLTLYDRKNASYQYYIDPNMEDPNQYHYPLPIYKRDSNISNESFKPNMPAQLQKEAPHPPQDPKKPKKKKRSRGRHVDEEAPIGGPCFCSNSGCLKRYCRCFHNGGMCGETCQCTGCQNNEAFAEKRKDAIDHVQRKCHRNKKVPKDALFKLEKSYNCNCKKTNCKKNYCECFLRGQKCTTDCECENCENGQEEAFIKEQENRKRVFTSSRRKLNH